MFLNYLNQIGAVQNHTFCYLPQRFRANSGLVGLHENKPRLLCSTYFVCTQKHFLYINSTVETSPAVTIFDILTVVLMDLDDFSIGMSEENASFRVVHEERVSSLL